MSGAIRDEWTSPDGQHRILLGDCLEILPTLDTSEVAAVISDPVWPNAPDGMFPGIEPYSLFRDAMHALPQSVERIAVQFGCNSDPRILSGIPERFPFVRCCWMEYTQPGNVGRVLYTNDVAYLFGNAPKPRKGNFLISGRCLLVSSKRERFAHPCYRQLQHIEWQVNKFTNDYEAVLDPFAGSCTVAVACARTGRRSISIEIERRYFEIGIERMEREAARMPLFDPPKPRQTELFADSA